MSKPLISIVGDMVITLEAYYKGPCHDVRKLLRVGLHWRVPFIEDLSETVQVVW